MGPSKEKGYRLDTTLQDLSRVLYTDTFIVFKFLLIHQCDARQHEVLKLVHIAGAREMALAKGGQA